MTAQPCAVTEDLKRYEREQDTLEQQQRERNKIMNNYITELETASELFSRLSERECDDMLMEYLIADEELKDKADIRDIASDWRKRVAKHLADAEVLDQ